MSFLLNPLVGITTGDGVNGTTALGVQALKKLTTGSNNTIIGMRAGLEITSGSSNTAVGYTALANVTNGIFCVAVGYAAASLNKSNCITAIGSGALENNTTGEGSTAVGFDALWANATGYYNTAVGYEALKSSTLGGNTAIGFQAGSGITTAINCTLVGYQAAPSTAGALNEVTLGNSFVSTLRCAVTTITAISDGRDKKDIETLAQGLAFVESLKPVSFTWDARDGSKVDLPDTGFIAQDLVQTQAEHGAIPGLVFDANPDRLEVGPGKLLPVLVKAIQELSEQVRALQAALDAK